MLKNITYLGKVKKIENFPTSGQNLEFLCFLEDKKIFDFSEKKYFLIEGSKIWHLIINAFLPQNKKYLRIFKKKLENFQLYA